MAKSILLSDAIDEFLKASALSNTAGTVAGQKSVLKKLLATAGNIWTKNLGPQHGEKMLALLAVTQRPTTMHTEMARLRGFSRWLQDHLYLQTNIEPFRARPPKIIETEKLKIPSSQFPALLNAASHPVERLVLALGVYLFLRQGEIKYLRVGDVDLEAGRIKVTVIKTKTPIDWMPISAELDSELRRWMTYYARNIDGPLEPSYYLAAGRTSPRFINTKGVAGAVGWETRLQPTKPCHKPEKYVQKAMREIGFATISPDGRAMSEGVHTLRRSGALALYVRLLEMGYDGAARTVQAMLHHTSLAMTERYLGINLDKKRRDTLILGQPMYRSAPEAQVLRLVAGEGD